MVLLIVSLIFIIKGTKSGDSGEVVPEEKDEENPIKVDQEEEEVKCGEGEFKDGDGQCQCNQGFQRGENG